MEIKHLIRAAKVLNLLFASIAENSYVFLPPSPHKKPQQSAVSRCVASQIRQHDVARPCQKSIAAALKEALHLLPEQFQDQHSEENSACGHDPAGAFEKKPIKMTTRKGFPLQIIHVYLKTFIYGWAKAKKIQRFRSLYVQSQKYEPYRYM